MRSDEDETFGVYSLELLHHAIAHGDQEVWILFHRCLEETVLTWLHEHPNREVVCRGLCEKHLVAQAFERFRQATVRTQMTFETLDRVLVYLRANLQGVILDALRTLSVPGAVSRLAQDQAGEPGVEVPIDSNEFWEALQTPLSSAREHRLVYLLYHCGLRPREILHCCPQEWSDIKDIYHLQRNIIEQLLPYADTMNG